MINLTDFIIDNIIGNMKKPENLMSTPTIIPTPQEFFNKVSKIETVLEVNQACNFLLDSMCEKFKDTTISRKLSAYKKLFYEFQHENPDLNDEVKTKNGKNIQHIAGRLLTLSDEQKKALGVDRNERDNARAGFDKEGELRDVDKPPVDIQGIVKRSCELLASTDPHTIGVGILNLTGLRANEQHMTAREYPDWGVIIERDMVVLGEFLLGFKGISKKSNIEDTEAYHSRVTLAPAQLIVDAQKRFQTSKAVQSLTKDYKIYEDSGFVKTFRSRYIEIFGMQLSTIEAYDDNDNLMDLNGSPHKGRAFYACALRAILKAKGFSDIAASKYVQLCLAHESENITIKYLGRYDTKEFINPIDIDIPLNINELGKMNTTPTITLSAVKQEENNSTFTNVKQKAKGIISDKTFNTKASRSKKASPKETFDINTFINGLDAAFQVKFAELMNSESSLTNAVLALINTGKQTTTMQDTTKKKSVSDEVADIVNAIMIYNKEQTLEINRLVPTYSIINKISEKLFSKAMAKTTVDTWLNANSETLHKELESLKILGGLYNTQWNGKHHRKTMDSVIDLVIGIFNRE